MSEKYLKQITKKLKCSKAQREEIKKQLASDIMDAAENGATEEELRKRMGTPAEIAEEFNRSFPDSEHKKYRIEKWRRRLIIAAAMLLLLGALLYWFLPKYKAVNQSSTFREDTVKAQAEYMVQLLNEENYEALQENASADLKKALTAEFIGTAKAHISDDWGTFISFGNFYMSEVEQMSQKYAVVQINASYENSSVTYTLSFDTDMKLAGLYMK